MMELIGFGPGGCGYSEKYKSSKNHGRLCNALIRRYNKYIVRPKVEKHYVSAIESAIKRGFRWIDYSCAYGDGKLLGEAIKQSGIDRSDLIITTRVSNYAQREHCVREEFLNFLKNAQLDYVDILQFHWPVTDLYLDTWREMEKLYEEGYVKHLGVANCHSHHLEEIFKVCSYKPEVGQFEIHPLFTQKPLIEYYSHHNIKVCAYTPIARFDDRLMRLPMLKNIAAKYGKSITQIVLRWHIQNGIIPIVRSLNPSHQKENLDLFDFTLTADEKQLIDGVNINSRLRYDPDNCDFSIL